MSLSVKDLEKIAQLAKIRIADNQMQSLNKDLDNILTLVEQMNTVDTANIEALAHPVDETQALRNDVVTETDERETFERLAPLSADHLYLVPKVISNE